MRHALSAQRDIDPGNVAQMLIAEGRREQAIALLERDYAMAATGTAAGWLGWALHQSGRADEAAPLFGQSMRQGMSDEASFWIQTLLHRSGDYELAAKFGDASLVGAPAEEFADLLRYNQACTLARLDQPEEAIDLLTTVGREMLLAHMPTDDDLEAVRAAPGFTRLLERFQPAMA